MLDVCENARVPLQDRKSIAEKEGKKEKERTINAR